MGPKRVEVCNGVKSKLLIATTRAIRDFWYRKFVCQDFSERKLFVEFIEGSERAGET